MWQRAWTLLAVLTLLSSMLAWSAVSAKPVFANTGPATKLGFTQQPAGSNSADDTIAVTVAIQDAGGATVEEGTDSIAEITLSLNASNSASIEETDLTETAVAGLASFSVHVRKAGSGYTFTATSGSLTDGMSDSFDLTPGEVDTTVLTPDPAETNADLRDVAFTATGVDAWGNAIGDVTSSVGFGIDGADSSCTANSCGSHKVGSYTVSDTTTDTGTAALSITPGALHHFVFNAVGPQVAGATFNVTVKAYDLYDNLKTDYEGGAVLSGLAASPGCSGCSPTLASVAADYGTLTWDDGVGTATGVTAYAADGTSKITITDGSVDDDSAAFAVDNAPTLGGFDLAPITNKVAGTPFTASVTAHDAYGNILDTYDSSAAALSGLVASPGCTGCTPTLLSATPTYGTLAWSGGTGTASVTAFNAQSSASLTVTDGSRSNASTFDVDNSTTLAGFDLATVPSQVAGTAFPASVTAFDPYGNVLDTYDAPGAHLTGLAASPGCTGCSPALVSVVANHGTLAWSGGTATASVTPYNAQTGAELTVTDNSISNTSTFDVTYKDVLAGLSITDIPIPKTAGTFFVVTATAHDQYGNLKKNQASGTLSGLLDSPGCTAADCETAITAASATYMSLVWNGAGTLTANVTPKNSQAGAAVTLTSGAVSDTSNQFTVNPAGAAKLVFFDSAVGFDGRPVHTKVAQPMYSVCVPPGTGGNPCALPPVSTGMKVLAIDGFGNRKDGVSVTISKSPGTGVLSGLNPRTTAGGTPGTAGFGEATFEDLKISLPNDYTLTPSASGTTVRTTVVSIVNDLEACDGTNCDNSASNAITAPASKLQKAFGEIQTSGDFFDPGTGAFSVASVTQPTNVLFSTQFVPGTQTNQAACGNTGSRKTIGDAVDMSITGLGAADTAPSTTMVLIMPKDTIKAYGVTARSATSFNVCLGALRLTSGSGWKAKNPSTQKGAPPLITTVVGAEGRYWGTPVDCGTAGLAPDDPCIGLKTKQAATAKAYLVSHGVMTATEFDALGFKDADLMLIVEKKSPWDAKGGGY